MNRRRALQLFLLMPGLAVAGQRRENRAACERLDARLEAIESERRRGYTAKRGRQLQAKREAAQRQRRALCR